jgi:hypothetical protein
MKPPEVVTTDQHIAFLLEPDFILFDGRDDPVSIDVTIP